MANQKSKSSSFSWLKGLVVLAIAGSLGAAYMTTAKEESSSTDLMQAPPPPVVEFIEMKSQKVRIWTNFSGRLAAVDIAEIKPLVSGELQKVNLVDGQQVKKGELLFVIDPRPYQAAVKQIQAQLESAKSRAKLAQDELVRTEQLVKSKLVSDSVYDAAKNEHQVAMAQINEVESALAQARLDLDYCYIRAPFSGRASRAEITVGNIVETTPNAPILTTIVADDKLYAEFDVDEQSYLRSVRGQGNIHDMPVYMTLAADESVRYEGNIHSFDNQLDITSGTIRARAIFDNTDGVLIPGMYANVSLGSATEKEVLLLSEKAVGTNQDKKFVYVISEDNQALYREVALGPYYQQQRVILSGVNAGDRVIVNGLSHIRPNTPVSPKAITDNANSSFE